jgi:tetratricopeptide (TPR) repeat protein
MADVSKIYQKAKDYMTRKNYDPAIDLYKQILAMDPDYAPARRDIRQAAIEKYEMQGYPPKFLTILLGLPGQVRLLILGLSKNHEQYALVCEEMLARDPKNAAVAIRLGKALWRAGYLRSALAAFEGILGWDPANFEALVSCGDLARSQEKLEEAIEYFQRAQRANPRDKHVNDSIRDLSAMISIRPREKAESYRDLVQEETVDEAAPVSLDEQISRARQRAQKNPRDAEAWVELGNLLQRKGDNREALKAMERAAKANPGDRELVDLVGDLRVAVLEDRVAAVKGQLSKDPKNAELLQKLAALETKKTEYEIQEFRRRIKLYPTDLSLQFSLGGALFRGGQIDEAIAAFQHAKKDPKRARESCLWLGRCFLSAEKYKMSINQFQAGLEQDPALDFLGKELHYYLGKAKLGAGDKEGALQSFEIVYEEDINFRDVADVIESLG